MGRTGRSKRLTPLSENADGLLLAWRPSAGQRAMLLDWVGQRAWRADPSLHTVGCDLNGWALTLDDVWPSSLGQHGLTISRGQVFEVARRARAAGEWVPLLAATYAWGYGTSGLGRYRFQQLAARKDLGAVLGDAVHVLDKDGPVAAYTRLRGAVRGFGPAFFTKFLYFAGGEGAAKPAPLILDARVAAACRAIAMSVTQGSGVDPDLANELAWWQWGKGAWTPHRYDVYLRLVGAVNALMEASSEGRWPMGRTDVVELAMFDPDLLQAGVWS